MKAKRLKRGDTVGKLLILNVLDNYAGNRDYYYCLCECGEFKHIMAKDVHRGNTRSCGCLQRERARTCNTKHGMRKSKIYGIWNAMKNRCSNKNCPAYMNYGGRGIEVCGRWLKFENFLADMGERPEGKTLDRIDNDKGYSPGNCKWSTRTEQARNKRNNHIIAICDISKSLAEWLVIYELSSGAFWRRKYKGWSDEDALRTLKRKKKGVYSLEK